MNTRKSLTILMVGLIALMPQKTQADHPSASGLMAFGIILVAAIVVPVVGVISGIAGLTYSLNKYTQPTPQTSAELIESSKDLLQKITDKYGASISIVNNSKQSKTSEKQLSEILKKCCPTRREFFRMLRTDIKKLTRTHYTCCSFLKKLSSDNKYNNLDDYEHLEELAQKSETLLQKLKNLQSYVKHATNLF